MRKLLFIMMSALLIAGCSQVKTTEQEFQTNEMAETKTEEPKVEIIQSYLDFAYDFSNKQEMYQAAEKIALIRIDSIDGTDNYDSYYQEYVSPFTFGTATVLEVYKGDLEPNTAMGFTKLGGAITWDQWFNGLTDRQKNRVKDDAEKPEYIKMEYDIEDTDLVVGKTYLAYLHNDLDKVNDLTTCAIIGFGGGLREIQGNPKAKTEAKVYNNFTKEWESLADVLDVE